MKTKTAPKLLKWSSSKLELDFIRDIVIRANKILKKHGVTPPPAMNLHMDIEACHANGCELDLGKLLNFPDFDFMHDVNGIHRHINRTTGELENCFVPRCALPV